MQRKDTHSAWIDLTIFALVFAFFLYSAKKLVSRPNPQRAVAAENRSPATLSKDPPEQLEKRSEPAPTNTILTLDCLPANKPKHVRTNLEYLRLSAQLCEEKKIHVLDSTARNETNGAEISAFVDRFTLKVATNYFHLQNGTNKIRLEFILSNGKKKISEINLEKY